MSEETKNALLDFAKEMMTHYEGDYSWENMADGEGVLRKLLAKRGIIL